mmetsp:Transcript_133613/g.236479  ORF Transcript_133613/g.236479 Transcript_133613/m.236479 type:complete len:355 (+) Transcript_133613:205-1269(+)
MVRRPWLFLLWHSACAPVISWSQSKGCSTVVRDAEHFDSCWPATLGISTVVARSRKGGAPTLTSDIHSLGKRQCRLVTAPGKQLRECSQELRTRPFSQVIHLLRPECTSLWVLHWNSLDFCSSILGCRHECPAIMRGGLLQSRLGSSPGRKPQDVVSCRHGLKFHVHGPLEGKKRREQDDACAATHPGCDLLWNSCGCSVPTSHGCRDISDNNNIKLAQSVWRRARCFLLGSVVQRSFARGAAQQPLSVAELHRVGHSHSASHLNSTSGRGIFQQRHRQEAHSTNSTVVRRLVRESKKASLRDGNVRAVLQRPKLALPLSSPFPVQPLTKKLLSEPRRICPKELASMVEGKGSY